MKTKQFLKLFSSVAAGAFFAVATCAQEGDPGVVVAQDAGESIVVGDDYVLEKDKTAREVVVIGGTATIDGKVRHDVVVVFGKVKVNGEVGGSVTAVMSPAEFGADAVVHRQTVVVGGAVTKSASAQLGHRPVLLKMPQLHGLVDYLKRGVLLARPFPPGVQWVWIFAGICLLLYLFTQIIFPKAAQSCVEAVATRPAGSFFAGIAVVILIGPVITLLAISVVGLLIVPVLFATLVVALIMGKVAVYRVAGQQLGNQLHAPSLQLPLVALVIGTVVFYLFYMVPVIGFAVWSIATALALGGVTLAAIGSTKRESVRVAPPAAGTPVSPINPSEMAPVEMSAPPVLEYSTLPRVGFWLRLWAGLLDFILVVWTAAFLNGGVIFAWLAYQIAMLGWKGTTVGGIVLGLKVVRTDGRPIGFGVATVRVLASFFSAFVLFIGFFWAGWSRDKQSWHDKIAGTIVVKVPGGTSLI
jgi:uncharacterized RDD family membrane protein YckC